MQHTCDALMRDGTATNRITNNSTGFLDHNGDRDTEYGRNTIGEILY